MPGKLTFVHLTDLHIGDPEVPDPGLLSETSATLRAILAEVRELDPAFVIVSGDLVNRGTEASYHAVAEIFAQAALKMPIVFALGNHDSRAEFYRVLLGRSERSTAPYNHDLVLDGLHVIVLDTTIPGHIGGGLEAAQLDWLTRRLDAHQGLKKLIVMHHGPMLDPEETETAWESIGAGATARFREILALRDDIVGILSGHIHYDRVTDWYGIPLVVGIGHHNATDVVHLAKGHRSLAGASFAVCTLRDSGLSIAFAPQPSDRHELGSMTKAEFAQLVERFDGKAE
jgi:3',5'-cyclic AMP phosphodiesterase CpdA